MAGISGFFQFRNLESKSDIRSLIVQMNNQLIHRGPDASYVYADEYTGFGLTVLSRNCKACASEIIYNEDKSMVLIADGTVFSCKSLKDRIKTLGHQLSSSSDMEVVLHAYEEFDVGCFDYFDGCFSIAIYDIQKKQLLLARDRIGQKPLYYYADSDCLIFSSELKSLLSTGLIKKEIDEVALQQYFQLTYIPAPRTIYKNVAKLEAGNYLIVGLNGEIHRESYWDVVFDKANIINNYNECKKLLREAVFNSVEARMKDCTAVGAFLSGGIDSTVIVGVMSSISAVPIDTFTIGFKQKDFDESDRAKLVADLHKTNHHVFYLDYDSALEELGKIISQLDEPFADSSAIPTYIVSRNASRYVDTVLTGDSGDELFAGYSKYLIGYYSNLYKKIPPVLRKTFEKLLKNAPNNHPLIRKINKVVHNSEKERFLQRKELMLLGFKDEELSLLLKQRNRHNSLDFIQRYYDKYNNSIDEIAQTLYLDLKVVIEGDMMPKVDKMASLLSLDARAPLLAQEIVELAAKIPSGYKISRTNQKIILKDTFRDLIPKQLLKAEKRGFGVPIGHWLRGPLRGELLELLDKDYIEAQGIFHSQYVAEVLDGHFTGKANRASELWALYVFQRWYRRYFV